MLFTRKGARSGRLMAAIASTVVAVLGLSILSPIAAQAASLVPVVIDLAKIATPSATDHAVGAGATVTYDFTITCSSTQTDCVNAALTDSFPAPLVFTSVNSSSKYTISPAANGFTLAFQSPLDEGGVGLVAGETVTFQAIGQVSPTVDASFDGMTVTNTAYVTVDNPDSNTQASADVLITAPESISSSVTTSVSPSTMLAIANTSVNFVLGATNTSNAAVDKLIVQDPGTVPSNAYDYLAVASLGTVTFPSGADRVQVDWYNGTVWTTGSPAATASLPAVTLSSIKGLRFTFTSTTGQIARGATAAVTIGLKTTAAVSGLSAPFSGTNIVSSQATRGATLGTVASASAGFTITPATISPIATKAFSAHDIVGGQDITVTLGASNGGNFSLSTLTVTEPAATTTSFAGQGLQFASWNQAGVFWPVGATAVDVTYVYSDSVGLEPAKHGTTRNAIPVPDAGRTVTSFVVSFTGTMAPGQYATLPYLAHTLVTASDATTTGTVNVDATTTGGQSASATAADTLTRRTARVNTTLSKFFTPATLYANSGISSLLSLRSAVAPYPTGPSDTGGSTVGATTLVVKDVDAGFWNAFDATAIVATEVPVGAKLTVRYTTDGGSTFTDLPGAVAITGASTLTLAIPNGLRGTLNGLEFDYTSSSGGLLPPGFNVQPNVKVTLRSQLRDNSGPVMPVGGTTDITLHNIASTTVTNAAAIPSSASSSNDAVSTLKPLPGGGGPGVSMISKTWQNVPATGSKAVQARSSQTATATINWGTGGLEYPSVVVSDTADDSTTTADDPSLATIGSTVYEAFDLYSIPAITSGMDPLIAYDKVSAVQAFSATSHSWVNLGNPCAGTACNGQFPGYTLTPAERADTIGVRLIFVENPSRTNPTIANPTSPLVGSGVAATSGTSRRLDLTFQLRDTRRSDGSAVLGFSRGAHYNTANAGEVDNSSRIEGRDAALAIVFAQSANDQIQIIDTSLNVNATKTWVDGPLGVPDSSTPANLYPTALMTVTAQNATVVPVNTLTLDEPTTGTSPFDYVNLTQIESTDPSDTTSTVVLTRGVSGTTSYTMAQALALSATQLQDVTAVTMTRTGRVASGATIGLKLHTQLRQNLRGTSTPISSLITSGSLFVPNTVTASVIDPGGTTAPSTGTDNVVTGQASATLEIASSTYGVIAGKTIAATSAAYGTSTSAPGSSAIQYDGSSTQATVTLTGQPTGNIRTTSLVIEDSTATFWNAYNLVSFPSTPLADSRQRVQVDVLLGASGTHFGTSYSVSGRSSSAAGTISTTCAGDGTHPDCWVIGTPGSSLAIPTLPSGAVVSEIRGIRVTFTNADGSAWERPYNPIETVAFTVDRRQYLVSPSTDLVPSTLFTNTVPAPGETVAGLFSNGVLVTATANDQNTHAVLWSATDSSSAQVRYQHLPAKVQIRKGPFGAQSLGTDIPFKIAVTNTGGAFDKPLGGLVITDTMPVVGAAPRLVLPTDPDTGAPYAITDVVTYRLADASNATQTAPAITLVLGVVNPTTQTLTFTVDPSFSLPRGWTLTITARLQFQTGLAAGTEVLNSATVTADQPFDTCDYYTDDSTHSPQQTQVNSCTSTTRVYPLATAPVVIVKGVRGVGAGPLDSSGVPVEQSPGVPFDDLGILKTVPTSSVDCSAPNVSVGVTAEYYRYPCVPITRPGGTEEWASTFFNAGNIGLTKLVSIDVLPAPGDKGVIVNETRDSKWTPTLTTYPALVGAPTGVTYNVYYLTSRAVATQRCNGADIQNSLGMTPTSNPAMTAGYQTCVTNSSHVDDVANRNWQLLSPSIPDNDTTILPTIVALKFVVDMQPSNPLVPGDKLSFVYRSRTAAAPEVAETSANLGNQSIAYNSIAAAAAGIDAGNTVPNRFVTEPRKVGVALATGSLQLQKLVDGAGASYATSQFALNLACTSVGQSVPVLNSDGSSRTPVLVTKNAAPTLVQGLPLYASCAISEGGYGQTTRTIVPAAVVAQAPQTAGTETIFNPHPVFGVTRPAVELSTVTNSYALTTFTVSKTIDTSGALNAETGGAAVTPSNLLFSARCTFNNGATNVDVLSPATTTFALNSGGSWTSPSIPVGSSCTVTETNSRGAQSTSYITTVGGVAGSSTSGTAATAVVLGTSSNSVAFTNTYGVADLTVNKTIAGTWATATVAPGEPAHPTGTFTVNVTCTRDLDGVNPVDTTFTGTLTFSAATTLTHTIHNIAQGSNCTINETAGNSAGATTITQATAANNISGSVTKTVTNTFSNASLAVTKTVASTAVDSSGNPVYLDDPYTIAVSCTFQSNPVVAAGYTSGPMILSYTAADLGSSRTATKTLTGLPSGATCSVTETPVPANVSGVSIGWVAATSASVASTTASFALKAGANTTTVTNNYGVNHFTVQKVLRGAGAAQFGQGHFVFHVHCVAGSLTSWDGDVTLPTAGGAYFSTINNLAIGSVCSAQETTTLSQSGADAIVYKDGAGTVTDGTGVDTSITDPRVVVENWYLSGAVTVTKSVIGAGSSAYGVGPFTVTLECVRDVNGTPVTVTVLNPSRSMDPAVSATMTQTFTGLPRGSVCTVKEPNAAGATSTRIIVNGSTVSSDAAAGYSFTVAVDTASLTDNQAQPAVTVENTFQIAALTVTKTVDATAVDESGNPISYGPFPTTISCLFEGSAVYATGYSAGTPMQRNLVSGTPWILFGLPAGAACTVAENPMDAVTSTHVTVAGSVATPATAGASTTLTLGATGTTNSVDFTNTYADGSLELSKVVDGAGRTDWGTGNFVINVTCSLTDATGTRGVWNKDYTFTLATTAPVVLDHVAADAVCTVTETATGSATSTGITVGGIYTAGTVATATIAAGAAPSSVIVTNSFDETQIDVTKLRTGPGMALYGDGPFESTLACTFNGSAIVIPGGATRALEGSSGFVASYTGLPVGAACAVSETKTGGADSSVVSDPTLTTTSSPYPVTITNNYLVGTITAAKTILGTGAGLYGDGPFEVQLTCTREFNGATIPVDIPGGDVQQLTSGNGYSYTWSNLPARAACSMAETNAGFATTSVVGGPVIVPAAAVATIPVTNTFDLTQIGVTNKVTGNDAARNLNNVYVVKLDCQMTVAGAPKAVPIPGGADRDIMHLNSVGYTQLPAGATCGLGEVVQHSAQQVHITINGLPFQLTTLSLGAPIMIDVENVYNIGLASTGTNLVPTLLAASQLLIAGLVLMIVGRRRRRTARH